jgi:DNA-binding NarL/FixJ family response regulator
VRVLVLDDHPAVRRGIVELIEDQPDLVVKGVAAAGESAVSLAETQEVDVAVVDYHLGGRNGLWVTSKLKALPRPPRVVIFSAFANDHLAAGCVVAGADALVNKGSLGDDLCNAIRVVRRGRRQLPRLPGAVSELLRARLDAAEQITFGMLAAGLDDRDIERAQHLSSGELAGRRRAILNKIEALPGELVAAGPGRGGLDFERLLDR